MMQQAKPRCRPVSNRVVGLVHVVDPIGSWQAVRSGGTGRLALGDRVGTQSPPFGGVYPPQGQKQSQWRSFVTHIQSRRADTYGRGAV